jgi:hypothetical protein
VQEVRARTQGLEAQSSCGFRVVEQIERAPGRQGGSRQHERGAVRQGQPFLGARHQPRNPCPLHGLGTAEQLALEPGLAGVFTIALGVPSDDQADVRQRRQVAARTQGTLRRHVRAYPLVQHANERVGQVRPHARVAAGEGVGPDDHHGAHHLLGEWRPDAGAAVQDEVAGQTTSILGAYALRCEGSEPCVHPVDGPVSRGHGGLDPLPAPIHPLTDRSVQRRHLLALPCHGGDFVHRKVIARQCDHGSSLDRTAVRG